MMKGRNATLTTVNSNSNNNFVNFCIKSGDLFPILSIAIEPPKDEYFPTQWYVNLIPWW